MIEAFDVAAVRAAEEAATAGLPAGGLRQRAAAGLATELLAVLRARSGGAYGRRVVLLVGPGDNGGDALWAGARLAARGVQVTAVLASGPAGAPSVHAEGLAALRAAGGRVVDAVADPAAGVAAVLRADVVVDGLLGIGGRAGLREPAASLAEAATTTCVVAVDLPSGVDPGTGATPGPHVRADVTVTFGSAKPCHLLPPASRAVGELRLVDLGLAWPGDPAVRRLGPEDVARWWPVPTHGSDKYSRGVVGVVAGGATYTGAAVLSTGAAVRTGAGMVRYLGPGPAVDLVRARWPEVVPGPGRVQAWVLGPGVDPDDAGQAEHVRAALAGEEPCLVDAGALGLLPDGLRSGEVTAPLLLTPHAGELARLLTDLGQPTDRAAVEAAPLTHARRVVDGTGATVLLKGAVTLVVPPEGPVLSQADAPSWLATAGAGDVLAGIGGALLAARRPADLAAAMAAHVHGRAGWVASGGGPVSAGSVLGAVPAAIREVLGHRSG